jgi:glycosyltransferase involved in cell wall biosynthesis
MALALRGRGHAVSAAGRSGGRFLAAAAAQEIEGLEIGGRNDFSPRDIWRVRRLMRRRGIDVVVTKLNRGIRLSGTAAILAGGRPVVLAHMGLMEAKRGWGSQMAYRLLLAGVQVPCRSIRDALIRDGGFRPEKIHVVPYGVDTESIKPDEPEGRRVRAELGLSDEPLAAMVARLDAQKGHEVFLDALSELDRVHALIIGTGALANRLKARAEECGLCDRVRFLGHRADVPRLLQAADVLVLSSHDEGLPYVVLEAMAVGLPVVATRVGGLEEAVQDGRTGLLVPPGSATALAGALRSILDGPDRSKAYGEAGRRRAIEAFQQSGMVREVERVLHQLVGPRRGRTR